jgi:hypothetical protein
MKACTEYMPVEIRGRKALARGGTRQLVGRGAHTRLRMGRDRIGSDQREGERGEIAMGEKIGDEIQGWE